jgi:hypothetical protein
MHVCLYVFLPIWTQTRVLTSLNAQPRCMYGKMELWTFAFADSRLQPAPIVDDGSYLLNERLKRPLPRACFWRLAQFARLQYYCTALHIHAWFTATRHLRRQRSDIAGVSVG